MSRERSGKPGGTSRVDIGGRHGLDPGKRAPTDRLSAPLPAAVRGPMEQRFGADFSSVRLHEDEAAAASGARAMTQGEDVHFAPGQYAPETRDGQFLLGHELAHVVQQRESSAPGAQLKANAASVGSHDALEREADQAGLAVASGAPAIVTGRVARGTAQCFNEDEHAYLGAEATKKGDGSEQMVPLAPGYEVPYGDLLALAGDHFGSLDQLREIASHDGKGAATREEIEYVRMVEIRGRKDLESTFSDEAKESAKQRYYKLAAYNVNHFPNSREDDVDVPTEEKATRRGTYEPQAADPKVYDKSAHVAYVDDLKTALSKLPDIHQSALAEYRYHHVWAMIEAAEAGRKGDPVDSSLAVEAFAGHFLTDSFSAGHIRTPRFDIEEHWNTKVPMFFHNLKGFMAEAIARQIAAGTDILGRQLREDIVLGLLGGRGEIFALLDAIGPLGFGDVVSGSVHDYDGERGVAVKIGDADVMLYGDGSFKDSKADDMKAYAVAAVQLGLTDVVEAHAAGSGGSTNVDIVLSRLSDDGLFAPEMLVPQVKPFGAQGQTQPVYWKHDSYEDLLASSLFRKALRTFAIKKADTIKTTVAGKSADIQEAVKVGVIEPLLADPAGSIRQVIEWTPTVTDSFLGHNTDDDSNDYWQVAKDTPGGLESLNYVQRQRLIARLLDGATVFDDEDAIMDVLRTAPEADQKRLISEFSWSRLESDIDDWWGSDFADTFPWTEFG